MSPHTIRIVVVFPAPLGPKEAMPADQKSAIAVGVVKDYEKAAEEGSETSLGLLTRVQVSVLKIFLGLDPHGKSAVVIFHQIKIVVDAAYCT